MWVGLGLRPMEPMIRDGADGDAIDSNLLELDNLLFVCCLTVLEAYGRSNGCHFSRNGWRARSTPIAGDVEFVVELSEIG